MIELSIDQQQIERARKHYDFATLKNSITNGEKNIFGAIGEIVVFDHFKTRTTIDFTSTFDFDMIMNGFKIDVKTRVTVSPPHENFFVDLPAANKNQHCDFFFFVFVLKNMSKAFIAGHLKPDQFFERATFVANGTRRPDGFEYRCDTFYVLANELKPFKQQ